MASENQQIYRQVYNSSEDADQLSAMDRVTCVLFRRGLLAAAYDSGNTLLTIHYVAYSSDRQVWELDFFEPLFHQEPLLQKSNLVTKVFVLSANNIIVPDELHEQDEAEYWLSSIFFTESKDVTEYHFLDDDLAHYYYSIPLYIKELAKINSSNVKLMPLTAYHFAGNYTRGVRFHCLLSNDQASITMYHYGALLWHKVFDYSSAEDIVYYVRLICGEHKINYDKITMACNALSAAEYHTITELKQYFAGMTTGEGGDIGTQWSPVISLFNQLETCG